MRKPVRDCRPPACWWALSDAGSLRTTAVGLAAVVVAFAGGCRPQMPPGPVSAPASRPHVDAPAASPPGLADAAIDVRVGGREELQALVAQHRGQVVLVDFWATWCGPCKEQFPHTVALGRELAGRGLAVISVSLDDPEGISDVRRFLVAQGAAFDNLISRFGTGSQSTEAFGLRGDVPVYRLYDRAGQLRYQFSAEPEGLEHGEPLDALDRRVRELVGAQTRPDAGRGTPQTRIIPAPGASEQA